MKSVGKPSHGTTPLFWPLSNPRSRDSQITALAPFIVCLIQASIAQDSRQLIQR